jgi:NADPH:quinone reductase-like Zn-dependent oxidoreductase
MGTDLNLSPWTRAITRWSNTEKDCGDDEIHADRETSTDRSDSRRYKMKAAYFAEHGGPEKIIYGDYQDPLPGPGEVLVQVRACALNHVDLLLLDGRFPPPEGLPHINGCEVTGTLAALGSEVTGHTVGERVIVFPGYSCGRCEYCQRGKHTVCLRYGYLGAHKDGGYAELVKVPAENILPLPETISFEAGAAVPLAMLTSWHALVAQADLRPGQTVLVQAAGSGVGSAAIQIAKLVGAHVITTVGSDEKIEFARSLGADAIVNYRTQNFVEEVRRWTNRRGVDVVIEHIGAETFEQSIYCLTRLGTLVSIGSHASHWGRVDLRHVYSKNLRILGTNLGTIRELQTIMEFMVAKRLRPVVDCTFPLREAREAVQYLLERRNRGKILLISES